MTVRKVHRCRSASGAWSAARAPMSRLTSFHHDENGNARVLKGGQRRPPLQRSWLSPPCSSAYPAARASTRRFTLLPLRHEAVAALLGAVGCCCRCGDPRGGAGLMAFPCARTPASLLSSGISRPAPASFTPQFSTQRAIFAKGRAIIVRNVPRCAPRECVCKRP